MKKMLPLLRWPCLLQDVLNRRLLFKTNCSSTKGNHYPSFLRFWNWAEETIDAQICGGAEMLLKQKPPANIRKWIAWFYYLGIYTPLEARVYCSQ